MARARALLREAGVTGPVQVEMTIPNNPDLRQVGEVIQAMVKEAGFELKLNAMEFASSLQAANRGDFETYLVAWSGRVDPDGNIWTFSHSGGGQNDGKYSNPEVDRLLDEARAVTDRGGAAGALCQGLGDRAAAGPAPDVPLAPQEHRGPQRAADRLRAGGRWADPAAGPQAQLGWGSGSCGGSGRSSRRCSSSRC